MLKPIEGEVRKAGHHYFVCTTVIHTKGLIQHHEVVLMGGIDWHEGLPLVIPRQDFLPLMADNQLRYWPLTKVLEGLRNPRPTGEWYTQMLREMLPHIEPPADPPSHPHHRQLEALRQVELVQKQVLKMAETKLICMYHAVTHVMKEMIRVVDQNQDIIFDGQKSLDRLMQIHQK